jgi:hypothetical protein
MVMRYHWGLGVGHIYSHHLNSSSIDHGVSGENSNLDANGNLSRGDTLPKNLDQHLQKVHSTNNIDLADNPETFRDRGVDIHMSDEDHGSDTIHQHHDQSGQSLALATDDNMTNAMDDAQDAMEEGETIGEHGSRRLRNNLNEESDESDLDYSDTENGPANEGNQSDDGGDWEDLEAEIDFDDMYGDSMQDQQLTSYD